MRGWIVVAALVFVRSAGLFAQAPNVDALGPQVGAHVPDFQLVDQNGRAHTLASAMGPKGAMLVFFRSADW